MTDEKKLEYQESIKYGAQRELRAMLIFMEQGYAVSVPNMSARYDFIAEKYPEILRVQVKNLIQKKKKTENRTNSYDVWCVRPWSVANGQRRGYTIDDCDLVVGISYDSKNRTTDFAIVPVDEVAGNATEYRLSEHDNSKGKEFLNSYAALEQR